MRVTRSSLSSHDDERPCRPPADHSIITSRKTLLPPPPASRGQSAGGNVVVARANATNLLNNDAFEHNESPRNLTPRATRVTRSRPSYARVKSALRQYAGISLKGGRREQIAGAAISKDERDARTTVANRLAILPAKDSAAEVSTLSRTIRVALSVFFESGRWIYARVRAPRNIPII